MKKITLSGNDIINLIRGNEVRAKVEEYYYDQDAEDYLSTGVNSEFVDIEIK
jgi:hypothetical protein